LLYKFDEQLTKLAHCRVDSGCKHTHGIY